MRGARATPFIARGRSRSAIVVPPAPSVSKRIAGPPSGCWPTQTGPGVFLDWPMLDVRKGQAPAHLPRTEFSVRFRNSFRDPAFDAEADALGRLEEIAWQAYSEGRKAPRTRKAGPGYADPDYDLSIDWLEAKERIERARAVWADPASRSRVLVICGAARNDGTCPGEM